MENNPSIIVIRVKIRNLFQSVLLDRNDISLKALFTQIGKKFALNTENELSIKLIDNLHAEVDEEILPHLIMQYQSDSRFFLEVEVLTPLGSPITVLNLETHLKSHGCANILTEEQRHKSICNKSLNKLLDRTLDFLEREFGYQQSPDELEDLCFAMIELFPSLKITEDGYSGIEMLYDRERSRGLLYEKIRSKNRTACKVKKTTFKQNSNADLENVDCSEYAQQIEEISTFFKDAVLTRDKVIIIERLKETVELRKLSLKNDKHILDSSFHLYMLCPEELITLDFSILFEDVDPNGLTNFWPQINLKFRNLADLPKEQADIDFDFDLQCALQFLKCFPSHHIRFQSSFMAFIVICEDPETDVNTLLDKKFETPRIILHRNNHVDQNKYYISVGQSMISVPMGFEFTQVFDLYFKSHKVFGFDFHNALLQFMVATEYYIYGMKDNFSKLTANSLKTAKKIFNK